MRGSCAKSFVSIVLPCLNESASITDAVAEARTGLAAAGYDGEVIVVDNGSTDGSVALAADAGANVVHEARPGYGAALQRGFAIATGDIAVMADADLTYDLSRVGEMVAMVESGVDLVLANRMDGASSATMPLLHRKVGTPILSFLVRRAAGGLLDVRDSQSGYRAFRLDRIRQLGLQSPGMEFASEMLVQAAAAGLSVGEVKMDYRPRVGESKLNTFDDGFRHLKMVALLMPSLGLLWPGVFAMIAGLLLSLGSLLQPEGLPVGGGRWQPVFFAPIAVVVGSMLLSNYLVVTIVSPFADRRSRAEHTQVRRRMVLWAAAMLVTGTAVDVVLFARWVLGLDVWARSLALAGLAQALLLSGVAVLISSFMYWLMQHQTEYERGRRDRLEPMSG